MDAEPQPQEPTAHSRPAQGLAHAPTMAGGLPCSQQQNDAMMAKIRRLPAAVATAVKDLTDAQSNTPYREGGWTVGAGSPSSGRFTSERLCAHEIDATEVGPALKPYQDAWRGSPTPPRCPSRAPC